MNISIIFTNYSKDDLARKKTYKLNFAVQTKPGYAIKLFYQNSYMTDESFLFPEEDCLANK
jgi:hypothetical protein